MVHERLEAWGRSLHLQVSKLRSAISGRGRAGESSSDSSGDEAGRPSGQQARKRQKSPLAPQVRHAPPLPPSLRRGWGLGFSQKNPPDEAMSDVLSDMPDVVELYVLCYRSVFSLCCPNCCLTAGVCRVQVLAKLFHGSAERCKQTESSCVPAAAASCGPI